MKTEKILKFLQKKFPNKEIVFIGSGSDSTAFRIDDYVIRVPHNANNIKLYLHEESVCRAIKKFIDFDIPEITVHDDDILWIQHKMVMGHKWSWHKFMWQPSKQRNLGKSLAKFMAQIHDHHVCDAVKKAKNIQKYKDVYMPWDEILPYLQKFLRPKQLAYFHKHYDEIVSKPIQKSDMVLCHLGIKGPNSVVDKDGNLTGVFDFCNAGIYERWRDMVLVYLMAPHGLYKTFCREYKKIIGIKVDTKRISDLTVIEFLWTKRWYHNGKIIPLGDKFTAKNIAAAMAHFHKMPKITKWLWYYTKK